MLFYKKITHDQSEMLTLVSTHPASKLHLLVSDYAHITGELNKSSLQLKSLIYFSLFCWTVHNFKKWLENSAPNKESLL